MTFIRVGDRDANFYLWGAMGGAALVGLGLAQAQPDRTVVVITGDGEQLMGFGGAGDDRRWRSRKISSIVVIDNNHFGETGMQQSHTGLGRRASPRWRRPAASPTRSS